MTHADWQLGNWIRSSQQNTEIHGGSHATESPAHKRLPPTRSSKCSSVEALNPTSESKPQLCSHQKQLGENLSKPQPSNESLQNNCSQQITHKSPDTRCRRTSGNTDPSKPAKAACPEDTQATIKVKSVEVVATQDKDPSFSDRPKVKAKTGHCKNSKDRRDCKTESKRTKHGSHEKQKAKSDSGHVVTQVLHGQCPSCGVRSSSPCSCPTPSPTPLDQLSPAPPVTVNSRKFKTETTHQKGTKTPHKGSCPAAHQHSEKPGKTPKVSWDPQRPPATLLVKINLRLLSRIPPATNGPPNSVKRPAVASEQDEGSSGVFTASKPAKTSKKGLLPNVRNVPNLTLFCLVCMHMVKA